MIVAGAVWKNERLVSEDLVKKKIPENVKEIALARSYGDLSENFEYKAAKQMQAVLARRRTLNSNVICRMARGTGFENPDTSRVSIGTIVTVREGSAQKSEETYTILGAWDGDPERHIISYKTAIAQAVLGHSLTDAVTLADEQGADSKFEIVSIEAAPADRIETVAAEAQAEPVVAE